MIRYTVSEDRSNGCQRFHIEMSTDSKELCSSVMYAVLDAVRRDKRNSEETEITHDDKGFIVCGECGCKVSTAKEFYIYCPRCGKKLNYEDSIYRWVREGKSVVS